MRKKLRKYRYLLILFVLLLAVGLFFPIRSYFFAYADELLYETLSEMVNEQTQGKYGIEYDELRYNVFTQRFKIGSFQYQPTDSNLLSVNTSPDSNAIHLGVDIAELEIHLENQFDFFFGNSLSISHVVVNQPKVKVVNNQVSQSSVKLGKLAGNLYALVTEYLEVFELKDVKVNDALLSYQLNTKDFQKTFDFNTFSFQVNDFKLDRAVGMEKNKKIMFTDDFILNSGKQVFILPDSLHEISFDRFYISLKKQKLSFHNLKIKPTSDLDTNSRSSLDLFLPELALDEIDFNQAFYQNKIEVKKLKVERPAVNLRLFEKDLELKAGEDQPVDSGSIMDVIQHLNVERLLLDQANFWVQFTGKDRVKRKFLLADLTYKCQNLNLDSTSFRPFVLEDLNNNFNLKIGSIKHEVPQNGFMLKTEEVNYSSITRKLKLAQLEIRPNAQEKLRRIRNHEQRVVLDAVNVDRIAISRFKLTALYDERKVKFNSGKIVRPEITLLYDTAFVKDSVPKANDWSAFMPFLDSLNAQDFSLENALLTINDVTDPSTEFARFESVDFYLPKEAISQIDEKSKWYDILDKAALSTSRCYVDIPGIDSKAKWSSLDFSSAKSELLLAQLEANIKGKRSRIDLNLSQLKAQGFSLPQLSSGKQIELKYVEGRSGIVDINQISKAKASGSFLELKLDSVVLDEIQLTNRNKDIVMQEFDQVKVRLGGLHRFKDSLNVELNQVASLQLDARSGYMLLDKRRHIMEFDQFQVSSSDSLVYANQIEIRPVLDQKKQGANAVYRSSIDYISLEGFYFGERNALDQLQAQRIDICSPEFRMSRVAEQRTRMAEGSLLELHSWFSNVTGIGQVAYEALAIENGLVDMSYQRKDDPEKIWITSIHQYDLTSTNFTLDSNQRNTDNSLFYAETYDLKAYQVHQSFPDSLRDFYVEYAEYSSGDKYLKLQDADWHYMVYEDDGDSINRLFIEGQLPLLEVEGIRPLEIRDKKKLNLKRVHLKHPQIDITQFHRSSDIVSRELNADKAGKDEGAIEKLILDELELVDGDISWEYEDSTKEGFRFKHVKLNGDELELDQQESLPKFAEVELSFGSFRHDVLDKFYDVQLDSFYLNSSSKVLQIEGASLIPRYRIFEFAQKAGWEKGRLEMHSPTTRVEGFDVKELIYNQSVNAQLVQMDSLWVRSFKNKKLPMIERNMPLPMELLRNAKYNINIDSVSLQKGYVEHRQLASNGVKNGTIKITDLRAGMNNITNDTGRLSTNDRSILKAHGKLYGEASIDAEFEFFLKDPDNRFTADASVSEFDAKLLNEYMEHTAFVRIRKGTVDGAEMNFTGYDNYGVGEMKLLYKNLHVDFLNHDTAKTRGLIMKTFLANRVVNTQNPHFFITKKGDIFYRRDTARAVFQYWTMLAMSGVASSTGIHNNRKEKRRLEKEIKRLRKEELRKEKAIRRREEELEEEREENATE